MCRPEVRTNVMYTCACTKHVFLFLSVSRCLETKTLLELILIRSTRWVWQRAVDVAQQSKQYLTEKYLTESVLCVTIMHTLYRAVQ